MPTRYPDYGELRDGVRYIGVASARICFADLATEVAGGRRVVITKYGKPYLELSRAGEREPTTELDEPLPGMPEP